MIIKCNIIRLFLLVILILLIPTPAKAAGECTSGSYTGTTWVDGFNAENISGEFSWDVIGGWDPSTMIDVPGVEDYTDIDDIIQNNTDELDAMDPSQTGIGQICVTGPSTMISGSACLIQAIFAQSMFDLYCALVFEMTPVIQRALELYVIIFAVAYLFGISNATAKDAIIRFIKISIIYLIATTPEYFYFWIYDMFLSTLDAYSTAIIDAGVYTGNTTSVAPDGSLIPVINPDNADPNPAIRRNGFFDRIDDIFLDTVGVGGIAAMLLVAFLLFVTGVGIPIAFMLVTGVFAMLMVFVRLVVTYITSIITFMFVSMFAPIFLTFLLFGATRRLFEGWMASVISYAMQPLLILTFIYVISSAVSFETFLEGIKNQDVVIPGDTTPFGPNNVTFAITGNNVDTVPTGQLAKYVFNQFKIRYEFIAPKYAPTVWKDATIFGDGNWPTIYEGDLSSPNSTIKCLPVEISCSSATDPRGKAAVDDADCTSGLAQLKCSDIVRAADMEPTSNGGQCVSGCTSMGEMIIRVLGAVISWLLLSSLTSAFLGKVPELARELTKWTSQPGHPPVSSAPVMGGGSSTLEGALGSGFDAVGRGTTGIDPRTGKLTTTGRGGMYTVAGSATNAIKDIGTVGSFASSIFRQGIKAPTAILASGARGVQHYAPQGSKTRNAAKKIKQGAERINKSDFMTSSVMEKGFGATAADSVGDFLNKGGAIGAATDAYNRKKMTRPAAKGDNMIQANLAKSFDKDGNTVQVMTDKWTGIKVRRVFNKDGDMIKRTRFDKVQPTLLGFKLGEESKSRTVERWDNSGKLIQKNDISADNKSRRIKYGLTAGALDRSARQEGTSRQTFEMAKSARSNAEKSMLKLPKQNVPTKVSKVEDNLGGGTNGRKVTETVIKQIDEKTGKTLHRKRYLSMTYKASTGERKTVIEQVDDATHKNVSQDWKDWRKDVVTRNRGFNDPVAAKSAVGTTRDLWNKMVKPKGGNDTPPSGGDGGGGVDRPPPSYGATKEKLDKIRKDPEKGSRKGSISNKKSAKGLQDKLKTTQKGGNSGKGKDEGRTDGEILKSGAKNVAKDTGKGAASGAITGGIKAKMSGKKFSQGAGKGAREGAEKNLKKSALKNAESMQQEKQNRDNAKGKKPDLNPKDRGKPDTKA